MIRIASTSDLEPGQCMYVVVDGIELAVARVGEEFFVLDNTCPHQGAPLGDGWLDGHSLTCPLHGWQFDVRTGEMPGSPKIKVKRYPVRVEGDAIFADLS